MEKITYGCMNGLIDWEANIRAGRANIKVHFTGGAMTRYGVTPAEFTTDNPFFQKVIENSAHFRNGTIRVLRRFEIGSATPETPESTPAADAAETAAVPGTVQEVTAGCLQDAQEYLRDKFEIPTYKVTSKAKADSLAASNGVKFIWE